MMTSTVLIIEDEQELREMMQEGLERAGYKVVAVSEGREALAALSPIERPASSFSTYSCQV